MRIEWTTDVGQAAWWVTRLHPFAQDVGSIVPDTFGAYARIFHPIDVGAERRSWADVAAMHDRVVHPEMQYDAITASAGPDPDRDQLDRPACGTLHRDLLDDLAVLLSDHTTTPGRCWYSVWEGYGQLQGGTTIAWLRQAGEPVVVHGRQAPLLPRDVLGGPRIEAPGRRYYLAGGPLDDVLAFHDRIGGQSPNVWWPDDRAWIVATEIDFTWTYLAADRGTVDAALAQPALEALEARPEQRISFDSDSINS